MKLASIEQVLEITPIEGADKIEIATVLGWQVVVKKNEYKKGDLCVYIPIDTTIDPTRNCFKFLANPSKPEERVKIKTIKLRGVFSQGLLLPISSVPSIEPSIGADVSELLDVQKYEKETILVQNGNTTNFIPFPTNIISKTDEDNLKTKYQVIDEVLDKDVYITLKMDGSSLTIISNNNEFIVCSRNYVINDGHIMYQFVLNDKIKDKILSLNKNIAIQGEFCGPKVNNNSMQLKNYKFYVFNIKDLDSNTYYGMNDIKNICSNIGLDTVPILDVVKCNSSWTISKFQDYANKVTYTTNMNKKVPAEGIVIRPIDPIWSSNLNKYLSFKIINQNYKD
jgi:RNA ligase (TIGR02306 family)